ncbi:hypothetical protein B0O80DRAFT_87402 [Mortierella sp. GBAus27b]|nr:hypothetical protein B0O80DRAFT_87402 [Mortierella sp. GBAus27b]
MAQTQHALHLPEIAFQVVQYLGTNDVMACSLVCKDFHASFEPLVWMNVHLGTFSSNETKATRYLYPLARLISVSPRSADKHQMEPLGHLARQDRIQQSLQRIAPWIRSLTTRSHVSPPRLEFSNRCTGITTLDIAGVYYNDRFDEKYWNDVEALLRQNSACLRSLTLAKWRQNGDGRGRGQPLGRIFLTCAQLSNLSILKINVAKVSQRDMEALWGVGQQLETLELTYIWMESKPTSESNQNQSQAGDHVTREEEAPTTTITTPAVRFPKLRKLRLEHLKMKPEDQFGQFIVHCPLLESLIWNTRCSRPFVQMFCDPLTANTWPCLDWIEIVCDDRYITDKVRAQLLASAPRSLRCLNANVSSLEEATFNLYRELGHFKTLTKVVLTLPNVTSSSSPQSSPGSVSSKQVQEVLESCPLLEYIAGVIIVAQDIIQGRPWVCHRLRWFQVMIGLEPSASNHVQAGAGGAGGAGGGGGRTGIRYTKEQKVQCHQIFERLGQLKQLATLDMRLHNRIGLHQYIHITSLPLRLRMGLGHLSTLRNLDYIGYHGSQEIQVVDMEWILQHWKNLWYILGSEGCLSVNWTRTSEGVVDERSRFVWESVNQRGLYIVPSLAFDTTVRQFEVGVEFDSESE